MKSSFVLRTIVLSGAAIAPLGCQPERPPPARVAVPLEPREGAIRESNRLRPDDREYAERDRDRTDLPPPPFDDVPIVSQAAPEQRAYVKAYQDVGRPRLVVFVNRTLEGDLLPVNEDAPIASVERRRTSDAGVKVEERDTVRGDAYYRDYRRDVDARIDRDRTDRFESTGPAEYRDRVDVYLPAGKYDEVQAKSIDYEAMENILTDWLAADGQVQIISPTLVRDRLTDEQVKELQAGRPRMRGEVARLLEADVLVQVQARPTRQTPQGLEVRLVAEAMNVRQDGNSVARAVVDIPPPLDKQKLNKYTRFVARKLMDGMIGTWTGYASRPADAPPPSARPEQAPQPQLDTTPRREIGPDGAPPPSGVEALPPQPGTTGPVGERR